jgi:hypothetical protein
MSGGGRDVPGGPGRFPFPDQAKPKINYGSLTIACVYSA